MLTGQQLDVSQVVKADRAGVLPHTQSLHRLELHRPREDSPLLVTQLTNVIERLEIPFRRIFVRSPAKIKLALLEGHEARSGEEAGAEKN